MAGTKSLTVRQIARECGVSIGTVSRVVNNQEGVGDEVRARIKQYLKNKDYNPYVNVPAIRKIRKNSIRVIMPWGQDWVLRDPFYVKGLEAIRIACKDMEFELLFADEEAFSRSFDGNTNQSGSFVDTQGVMLFCPRVNWDKQIDRLAKWNIPVALVNRPTDKKNVIVTMGNHDKAADDLFRHLNSLGHSSICLMGSWPPWLHLRETFREAAMNNGFAEGELSFNNLMASDENIEALLAPMYVKNELPDCFIGENDFMALRIMKSLHKHGYKVPADAAVVGYDNVSVTQLVYPGLTTINNPIDEMSAFAARELISQIKRGEVKGSKTYFDGELIVRESCGFKK